MTPTLRPRWTTARAWLALALPLAACAVAPDDPSVEPNQPVDELQIPADPPKPRQRKEAVEQEEAAPSVRDPFLTKAEDDALRRPAVVEEVAPAADGTPGTSAKTKKPAAPRFDASELELSSLFTSRDGKRHAVAYDRRLRQDVQIDEGQSFGGYIVTNITDEAIQLREKGGSSTRSVPFKRAASNNFIFKGGKK